MMKWNTGGGGGGGLKKKGKLPYKHVIWFIL